MRSFKVKVMGENWSVFLLKPERFKEIFDEDIKAVTCWDYSGNKGIFFQNDKDCLGREIVMHEVVHAYLYYTCTEHADLTKDSFEEVACDLFARHGSNITKTADTIHGRISTFLKNQRKQE